MTLDMQLKMRELEAVGRMDAGGPGSGRHKEAYTKMSQAADVKSQRAYSLSAISHLKPGAHALAWKAHMGAAEAHLKVRDWAMKNHFGDPDSHALIAKQHYAQAGRENKMHYGR